MLFSWISFPQAPEYPIWGHFKFLTKIPKISESKGWSQVSMTTAINGKKFDTGSFFLFCWDTVGLLFTITLIKWFFTFCSFWGVGKLTSLQLFHRRFRWHWRLSPVLLLPPISYHQCCCYQRLIIAGVVDTGETGGQLLKKKKINNYSSEMMTGNGGCYRMSQQSRSFDEGALPLPPSHTSTGTMLLPLSLQRPILGIKTKVLKFSSLLFTVTTTALLEISISSNSRNLLQFL